MDAPGDMRAFVRVVERQGFSAAATSLGLTPSAVSRLVSKLEERLGLRLLHRTTRRLRLTSEGEVYFARARSILADIDEVETEVRKFRGAPWPPQHQYQQCIWQASARSGTAGLSAALFGDRSRAVVCRSRSGLDHRACGRRDPRWSDQ